MAMLPFDQRLARLLVRPFAATAIAPNHLTAMSLLLALTAAALFASGAPHFAYWGAGLFVLARFVDHLDGELARIADKSTFFGYYFDYITGATSYAALFLGIGVGQAGGPLGGWALVLAAAGAGSAIISMFLNLDLDRRLELGDRQAVGYPAFAGFELEDGIYLLAPITWLGFLTPFFVAAGLGAVCYLSWTARRMLRTTPAKPLSDRPG